MSCDFYKHTLQTLYMQHEIELNISFNLIYSFHMLASNITGSPLITKLMPRSVHFYSNHGTRDKL